MKIIRKSKLAVYIHIPFCLKKCNYCDFISFPYEKGRMKKYISCLIREIYLSSEMLGIRGVSVGTIYIGGGTPSLLEPDDMERIISALNDNFNVSEIEEFTLEANPETVGLAKFEEFDSLGINRVSVGAQSFNDDTLKVLGRVHDSKQIYKAFDILRKSGFRNINLDLMFALPDETWKNVKYSLIEAVSLNPEHISYYSLTIEEGTEFYKNKDSLNLPTNDEEYLQYSKGIEVFEKNGYEQYEISNFARKGFESKHNKQYWRNLPYVGFGVSAYSYLRRIRFGNSPSVIEYCNKLNKDLLPVKYTEHLTGSKAKADHIILNLRLIKEGVDKDLYYNRFGTLPYSDFHKEIDKLKKLQLIREDAQKIFLTKRGAMLANDVFIEFLP